LSFLTDHLTFGLQFGLQSPCKPVYSFVKSVVWH
jgi:hypothetical protein